MKKLTTTEAQGSILRASNSGLNSPPQLCRVLGGVAVKVYVPFHQVI